MAIAKTRPVIMLLRLLSMASIALPNGLRIRMLQRSSLHRQTASLPSRVWTAIHTIWKTTAPAGYNVLKAPVKVVIDAEGNVTYGENSTTAAPDVKILNNAGAELPSTGGIGTTVFYVLGGVLVVCAGVLLITKRRMNKNA